MLKSLTTLALAATLVGLPAAAMGEKTLPMDAQVDIMHPSAKSLDAFKGRTILIEFFAHW